MKMLTIIILNYNTKDLTIKCIQSLQRIYKDALEKKEFEIIVVDNNSTDNSVQELLGISDITLIQNRENVGFAAGNNIGVKEAKGKYVLFLNSDTSPQDKGLIHMVEFLDQHKNVGILGAKLLSSDGTIQKTTGKFYTFFNAIFMIIGLEKLGFIRRVPKVLQQVDWVSGGAMMVRRDAFEQVGGFDQQLFMYIEDMELCYRLKKKGYTCFYYPNITIIHKEHGSSNRTFAITQIYKGLLYFYKKHGNALSYFLIKSVLQLKAFVLLQVGKVTKNIYLTQTYEKALSIC